MRTSPDEAVERNRKVVGLTNRGTLMTRDADGETRDTGETAREWVGKIENLRPGAIFDYYTEGEKKILREGLRRTL